MSPFLGTRLAYKIPPSKKAMLPATFWLPVFRLPVLLLPAATQGFVFAAAQGIVFAAAQHSSPNGQSPATNPSPTTRANPRLSPRKATFPSPASSPSPCLIPTLHCCSAPQSCACPESQLQCRQTSRPARSTPANGSQSKAWSTSASGSQLAVQEVPVPGPLSVVLLIPASVFTSVLQLTPGSGSQSAARMTPVPAPWSRPGRLLSQALSRRPGRPLSQPLSQRPGQVLSQPLCQRPAETSSSALGEGPASRPTSFSVCPSAIWLTSMSVSPPPAHPLESLSLRCRSQEGVIFHCLNWLWPSSRLPSTVGTHQPYPKTKNLVLWVLQRYLQPWSSHPHCPPESTVCIINHLLASSCLRSLKFGYWKNTFTLNIYHSVCFLSVSGAKAKRLINTIITHITNYKVKLEKSKRKWVLNFTLRTHLLPPQQEAMISVLL